MGAPLSLWLASWLNVNSEDSLTLSFSLSAVEFICVFLACLAAAEEAILAGTDREKQ